MTSMKAMTSAALVLFVLPVAAHGQVASENFDGISAQIAPSTDHFDNDSMTDWDFTQATDAQIAIAGQSNGGGFTNGLTNQYPGDQAIFLNYNGISPTYGDAFSPPGPSTDFGFHQSDEDHFALESFQLGNNLAGYSLSVTITVLRDSTTLGSGTFDLNTSSTSDGITYTYGGDSSGGSARPYGTLTFDGRFANATTVELKYAGAATPLIDNVEVSAPDMTAPAVTVEQATGQADPTDALPIHFTAVFSEPIDVSSFTASDVTLDGSAAGALAAAITQIAPNDGTTFDLVVSGLTSSGTVTAAIGANRVKDVALNGNTASTSTDNTVTYNGVIPQVAGTSLRATYVASGPSSFTVTFNEPVADTGSAGGDSVTNPANYLLVEAGADGTFDTLSCVGGRAGDDSQVPIAGVAYDAGTLTATVSFGTPLPVGSYRLLVCGTTSITDLAGSPLGAGTDWLFDFAVVAITAVPTLGFPGLILLVLLLAAGALGHLGRS